MRINYGILGLEFKVQRCVTNMRFVFAFLIFTGLSIFSSRPAFSQYIGIKSVISKSELLERQHAAGYARIDIAKSRFKPNDFIDLDIKFEGLNQSFIFNPFLDKSITLPCRIMLFSEEAIYLGDLALAAADQRIPTNRDIVFLDMGEAVGNRISISTSLDKTVLKSLKNDSKIPEDVKEVVQIGPGKYLIQAAYNSTFLSAGGVRQPKKNGSRSRNYKIECFRNYNRR